jgi:PAS domain S-box-containing protein
VRPRSLSEPIGPAVSGPRILLINANLAIAGLISCGALVGWLADLPLLTNWRPGFIAMMPVTAVAVLLIALGLLPQLAVAPRSRIAIGVIVTLLGASSLIQELGGLDLRLESSLAPAGAVPGHWTNLLMSPATALAVLLAGAVVAMLALSQLADAVRILAAGVGVIGATALLGYVLGIYGLYSFPPYNSIALPTTIASIAVSAAALTYVKPFSLARKGDWRWLLAEFFAPLLIFLLFPLWSWRGVEAQARADADRSVALASQYFQRVFEIQETALRAVLRHLNGRDAADIAADRSVHEFLSEIEKQNPASDAIILVSDSGHVIAWSRGFPAPNVDVSQRDYFKAHRNGGHGTYIGEVIRTAPFGAIGFTISRRDPATGIIAVADMPVDSSTRASDVQVSRRDDGMVLITTLPLTNPIGFQLPEDWFIPRLIRGEFKTATTAPATLDNIQRLWQFRKVGHYPVYAIYGLDAAFINAAWLHNIIPFGLLAFLASAATSSLSRVWQSLLANSEELFRTSILHAPMPVVVCDDREQILIINQAWLQQSGYSRDELHALEDWTTRAYGERSPEVLAYIRDLITAEPQVRQRELPIRTGNGVIRYWNFVDYALGALSDGRRVFISIAQDTTDRRAYEERIELLMRESHHRIKNILGLVQAVARQTAAREPEHFVERFTERVQALAANHDLLIESHWQGADVEDLVRVQLAHFADLVGSRIAVRGPKLRLNAAAAQAIGLAVHELATNASKYGALSTDDGRVNVDWRADACSFAISWTERGGPPVQPPDRRGFGSTVVEAMAKRAVGGEVDADYAPSGLGWHLTCPAANALEANPA